GTSCSFLPLVRRTKDSMSARRNAWSSAEVRFGRRPGKCFSPQILEKGLGRQVQLSTLAGDQVEFRRVGQDVRAKRPHLTAFHPALGIMRRQKASETPG